MTDPTRPIAPKQNHIYTVDSYLRGPENPPCVICGEGREAHQAYMDALTRALEDRRGDY